MLKRLKSGTWWIGDMALCAFRKQKGAHNNEKHDEYQRDVWRETTKTWSTPEDVAGVARASLIGITDTLVEMNGSPK